MDVRFSLSLLVTLYLWQKYSQLFVSSKSKVANSKSKLIGISFRYLNFEILSRYLSSGKIIEKICFLFSAIICLSEIFDISSGLYRPTLYSEIESHCDLPFTEIRDEFYTLDNVSKNSGEFINTAGQIRRENPFWMEYFEKYFGTGNAFVHTLDCILKTQLYLTSKKIKYKMVDFHSSRPGHDLRYALDGNLMKKLGWKPKISIEKRIDQVVNWTLKNKRWLKI